MPKHRKVESRVPTLTVHHCTRRGSGLTLMAEVRQIDETSLFAKHKDGIWYGMDWDCVLFVRQ